MKFYDQELAELILDLDYELQFSIENGYEMDAEYFDNKLERARALAERGDVTQAEFDEVNY